MRKFILTVISTIVCLCVMLSGCGCTGSNNLSFSTAFTGGEATGVGYTETAIYDVTFSDDNNLILPSADISKSNMSFKYKEGKYQTKLEVLATLPSKDLDDVEIPTTSVREKLLDKSVIRLTTSLTIKLEYTIGEETKTNEDFILTETYICPQELSFAPIYTKFKSSESILYLTSNDSAVGVITREYSTLYQTNSYAIKGNQDFSLSVTNSSGQLVTQNESHPLDTEGEYAFRSIIDNAELLFCARNLKEDTTNIEVFSSSYKTPQTLAITKKSTLKQNTSFTCGDLTVSEVDGTQYSIALADSYSSGIPLYLTVQAGAGADGAFKNRAVILEYVMPVMEYKSLACVGALVYKLSEVSVSN